MTVLVAGDLGRAYGDRTVFAGVNFELARGDRLAVVGGNGSGKSTLLRLLAGQDAPDRGRVDLARGVRRGYLPQELGEESGPCLTQPLAVAAAQPFAHLEALEEELRELEGAMAGAGPDQMPRLLKRYGELTAAFEADGGYSSHVRIRAVLSGLGFREEEFSKPVGQLSIGQRRRMGLARLLLAEPDLLLLDEPTNHLDVEAMAWLENYLALVRATVVLVAHDRQLLDRTVNLVLELHQGHGILYRGDYSAYVLQAEERREREQSEAEAHSKEQAKLEAYIRRYRAGERAAMAKSRQKALARMGPAVRPRATVRRTAVPGTMARRSGRLVLRAVGLAGGHGSRALFSGLDLELWRGDRLGIAGPNGSGKSTLLRVILGLQAPLAGRVERGKDVDPGYFSQVPEFPPGDEQLSALDHFLHDTGWLPAAARPFLARLGLTGDTALRAVGALSGGERTRLRLAELLATQPNLLILDEPTHHLDLFAREALVDSLLEYPGTLIIVTHDRHLLDRIATRLLYLKDGQVTSLEGRLEDNLARMAAPPAGPPRPAPPRPVAQQPARPNHRRSELKDLEDRIARAEGDRARLEDLLASPHTYQEGDPASVNREYRELLVRLEALYGEWEKLASTLP
jgi:ATP-binding cassette subfamily F protein 3